MVHSVAFDAIECIVIMYEFQYLDPPSGCQISAQKGRFLVVTLRLKFHTNMEDSGSCTIYPKNFPFDFDGEFVGKY